MSIATGAMGGAAMGAQIGSVAGPWGTAAGAVVGAVAGGISTANKQNAQQEGLDRLESIPTFDPMQLDFLDQLKREKRSVESGFTTDFQVAKDLNKEAFVGGLSVAETVGASNPALAFSLGRTSAQQYNTGVNQALGTVSSRGMQLTTSMGELINRIAQRKLDLEMVKTSQQLGIATDALHTNQTNANQFMAKLPGIVDQAKTGFEDVAWYNRAEKARVAAGTISAPIALPASPAPIGGVYDTIG